MKAACSMSSCASSAGDDEPGLTAYTKVNNGYMRGMFEGVKSVDNFAALLGVPKQSIPLVVPLNIPCKVDGCPFAAIERNGHHCPAHQRSWYPLQHHRGSAMLGPEFLRSEDYLSNCDCNIPACKEAGYFPGQDPIYINAVGRETVASTPHLLSDAALKKIKAKGIVKLYPWHWFPRHRQQNSDGKWELVFDKTGATKYYDDEGKKAYCYPPPRYTVKRFLEEEYFPPSRVRPQERWAEVNNASKMPMWMLDMLLLDGDSSFASNPPTSMSKPELRRKVEMWKARAFRLHEEKKGQKRKYEEQLAAAAEKTDMIVREKVQQSKRGMKKSRG